MPKLYIWYHVPYVSDEYHHSGSVIAVADSQTEAAILADVALGDPGDDYTIKHGYGKIGIQKRVIRMNALLHSEGTHAEFSDAGLDCYCADLDDDVTLKIVNLEEDTRYARSFRDAGCC